MKTEQLMLSERLQAKTTALHVATRLHPDNKRFF